MSVFIEFSFPDLALLCTRILRRHAAGISEYELLNEIKAEKKHALADIKTQDEISLFRIHFTLFHTLYQLKQHLYSNKSNDLLISPLNIRLIPFAIRHSKDLHPRDELESYYLDLKQLRQTTDKEIYTLLDNFWSYMIRNSKRIEALSILKLKDPVSDLDIKKQYRKLAFEHHPDRGGNLPEFQAITEAMYLLSGKNRAH